jgi:hypothetical protein
MEFLQLRFLQNDDTASMQVLDYKGKYYQK